MSLQNDFYNSASKGREVMFLVDVSGSMGNGGCVQALQAAMDVRERAFHFNRSNTSGRSVNVVAMLWADNFFPVDLADPTVIERYKTGIGAGSVLAPLLRGLTDIKSDYPQHFLIISDGMVGDSRDAAVALEGLLERHKSAFVEVILINSPEGTFIPGFQHERYAARHVRTSEEIADIAIAATGINMISVALNRDLPASRPLNFKKTPGA